MPIWDKLKNAASRLGKKPEPEAPEAEKPQEAEAPEAPEAVTIDTVIASIDSCKAFLLDSGRSPEEISLYSSALGVMQQALRGLHATVDITELLEAMNTVFTTAMGMTFSFGTSLDCNDAISTVNDAIRTIAGTRQSDVLIAALRLNIVAQNALILNQEQIIRRYEAEIEGYRAKQVQLLSDSGAKAPAELDSGTKDLFAQIDQRMQMRQGFIENARSSITNINQDILNLETSIETVRCNPNAQQLGQLREHMQKLIDKAPSLSELTLMIEEAQKNAAALYAKIDADIRQMREAIVDHALPITSQTQKRMDALLEEITRAQAQAEEQQQEAEQTGEQTDTDTLTM